MVKAKRISVCMATYNGSHYIGEQLGSILKELPGDAEVIISDDGSVDDTIRIINSFSDSRVTIISGPREGVVSNFENAINHASGDIIFLSDQDDVWLPGRVRDVIELHESFDLILVNAATVDESGVEMCGDLVYQTPPSKNITRLIASNKFIGCMMSFRSEIKKDVMPFPKDIPMHDWWIACYASLKYRILFYDKKLIHYRRHGNNVSNTLGKSKNNFFRKINFRLVMIWRLICRLM